MVDMHRQTKSQSVRAHEKGDLINRHLYYRVNQETYSRVMAWIRLQGRVESGGWCVVIESDRLKVLLTYLGVMYHVHKKTMYFTLGHYGSGAPVQRWAVHDELSVFGPLW